VYFNDWTFMKQKNAWGIALLIGAVAVGAGLLVDQNSRAGDSKGGVAPAWELHDLDGKTVHSSDFKGKVVILDFWATWCPPCRAELPSFVALQKKYQAQGLAVVGISVDKGGAEAVKSFAQKMGINYPIVLSDGKVTDAYGGIEGIPTTFIIDRNGHIVKQHVGLTDQDEFESEIKPLLSASAT
jgi:peroxiredoxin